ncbi:peptide/nickel transport system ATP-binding protein [Breoghania corrubedonensis]|uniref:Peptide/nickel transport system ATP-binding protein n=1 Tax=Breoghania corrubedonensis TaxID=665038 RepID=A0A2T5V1H9_9HYPH|nr:ABC transporter ATP-binding protein [Breoghania corrubedonensis]PTW57614.1 peptide/nickel transport system ATP-binding protein [Breoghania corrubedonensis]
MDIVEVEDLTIEFETAEGRSRAVDQVSFTIPQNRTVALVGESGSGKSVISQAIMGILPKPARITGGAIRLHDPGQPTIDIARLDPAGAQMRCLRGNRIAIIFQEPMTSLSPLHTIGDQIGEAVQLHSKASAAEARELTRDMLRLVRFPDPARALTTYPFELSGGLRQRAMIAMALVCRPALLIADEPTTALDVTIQAEILKLIKDVQGELGMSVLMITHDFGVVANVADKVVVIYHGRIVEAGCTADLFNDPRHDYLKALMRAVPRFGMEKGERLVPVRPIPVRAPSEIARAGGTPGEPLVRLDNVSKTYALRKGGLWRTNVRSVKALDAVNLTIGRGECLGLVGESGCGKTTTSKAILRAIAIEEGRIDYAIDGNLRDIRSFDESELFGYRRRAQMIFQDPFSSLNPRMTVNEILMEPLIIHKCGRRARNQERVRELMEMVGLDPRFLRRYPHSFSGGQRQRIGIARALALDPEFIICDEPVSALDVSVQAQILNLLKDLQQQLGLTYLFVSHNLAVVDYIADRIAVMCRGRLVELGETAEIIGNPLHPYTKALMAAVLDPSVEGRSAPGSATGSGLSDPADWPQPFRIREGVRPNLVEMAPRHFVCAPGYGIGPAFTAEPRTETEVML